MFVDELAYDGPHSKGSKYSTPPSAAVRVFGLGRSLSETLCNNGVDSVAVTLLVAAGLLKPVAGFKGDRRLALLALAPIVLKHAGGQVSLYPWQGPSSWQSASFPVASCVMLSVMRVCRVRGLDDALLDPVILSELTAPKVLLSIPKKDPCDLALSRFCGRGSCARCGFLKDDCRCTI